MLGRPCLPLALRHRRTCGRPSERRPVGKKKTRMSFAVSAVGISGHGVGLFVLASFSGAGKGRINDASPPPPFFLSFSPLPPLCLFLPLLLLSFLLPFPSAPFTSPRILMQFLSWRRRGPGEALPGRKGREASTLSGERRRAAGRWQTKSDPTLHPLLLYRENHGILVIS